MPNLALWNKVIYNAGQMKNYMSTPILYYLLWVLYRVGLSKFGLFDRDVVLLVIIAGHFLDIIPFPWGNLQ